MKGLAQLFEERGDAWNARNPQHHAYDRGYIERRHPDGTIERISHYDVDGYDQPTTGPRAAIRKREFVEPNPPKKVDLAADRLRVNRAISANKSLRQHLGVREVIRVR